MSCTSQVRLIERPVAVVVCDGPTCDANVPADASGITQDADGVVHSWFGRFQSPFTFRTEALDFCSPACLVEWAAQQAAKTAK